tara:strand:- start:8 stop:229 length:222 start_codon:yes stop_codon:yes gene_type:complete
VTVLKIKHIRREKRMELKYYIEAMMTQEPFVLAWEAFVFFMLLMFVSIIVRLHNIEVKVDDVIEEIIENIESK